MSRSGKTPPFSRALYLSVAGSLLFFLVYSTPHRVHHFFDSHKAEAHQKSADEHHDDHHRRSHPTEPDCVFQAAANGCQFGLTTNAPLTTAPPTEIRRFDAPTHNRAQLQYLIKAFQVRAPPKKA
jgi:hypothetical protein